MKFTLSSLAEVLAAQRRAAPPTSPRKKPAAKIVPVVSGPPGSVAPTK